MIVASLNLKQYLWNLCINTQHILLAMIEDIKISRGNSDRPLKDIGLDTLGATYCQVKCIWFRSGSIKIYS